MRKSLRATMLAGVGALAIAGGFSAVEYGVAPVDTVAQQVAPNVQPTTERPVQLMSVTRVCQPVGPKGGATCYDVEDNRDHHNG